MNWKHRDMQVTMSSDKKFWCKELDIRTETWKQMVYEIDSKFAEPIDPPFPILARGWEEPLLDVELGEFEVRYVAKDSIRLFSTKDESNVRHFESVRGRCYVPAILDDPNYKRLKEQYLGTKKQIEALQVSLHMLEKQALDTVGKKYSAEDIYKWLKEKQEKLKAKGKEKK